MSEQRDRPNDGQAPYRPMETQVFGRILREKIRLSSHSLPPLAEQGITLIQLGGSDSSSHWNCAVPPLVSALVGDGRPVFFVESSGWQSYVTGRVLVEVCEGDPLLRYHEDLDLVVYTPPVEDVGSTGTKFQSCTDCHGRRYYDCAIPTLHNIQHDLTAHDRSYGQSVVIFDDAVLLRPYFAVGHPEFHEPPVRLTADRPRLGGRRTFSTSRRRGRRRRWSCTTPGRGRIGICKRSSASASGTTLLVDSQGSDGRRGHRTSSRTDGTVDTLEDRRACRRPHRLNKVDGHDGR